MIAKRELAMTSRVSLGIRAIQKRLRSRSVGISEFEPFA